MKRLTFLFLSLGITASMVFAQDFQRKVVEVPKVDPAALSIDGQMNEPEWGDAAQADLITSEGFEIWTNKYYRESLVEPDYDALFGRMLWAEDSLFVFIHIDEFVNDSTNLYWNGQWTGDQLFISLSSRLAEEMKGWYDGNVYRAPEGPYHFLALGDQITLNAGSETYVPEEYRCNFADSLQVFEASNIARWATAIDTVNGVWNVEMAIYNPGINSQACVGFNIGGSTGSRQTHEEFGDAYAYYTWQPNVPDDPYAVPAENDPGFYNLASSSHWAVLHMMPGADEVVIRKEVDVPEVDPVVLSIDGQMDEPEWGEAAHADLITSEGFEIWTNKYYRESLVEPDYDALFGRMLWADDSLYVFIHIDEFVNDSTNLFWAGQWTGDQLFVSLSSLLGTEMKGWYDGNVYAAPEGPYHFLALGEDVSLNTGGETFVPEEYRCNFSDSLQVFEASNIARWATTIDTVNGVWNLEMAIYNPHVTDQSCIGFNIGGSTGSRQTHEEFGDAYAYYTWQPNVPDDPYAVPAENDPGFYNLASASHWAILNMTSGTPSSVDIDADDTRPVRFLLSQNYPNPFNPSTTIRFDLRTDDKVSLKVYNAVGQLVSTLIDGKRMSAGTYRVTWNASGLPTGVYFYRIEAGNTIETKKMTLVK